MRSSLPGSRASPMPARAAVAFALLFVVLLLLLHFLEPEFAPSWRMISEYELGRSGWMMRLAFFAWGASVLLLATALWRLSGTTGARIGRWWMAVIGVALFGAGIFEPNPITDTTSDLHNTVHTLCGAIVILTFPIAATLVGRGLGRTIQSLQRLMLLLTVLVWIGMVAYFGSIVISDAINPSAGRQGPEVYQGWPNRFMVATYLGWMVAVGQRLSALARG